MVSAEHASRKLKVTIIGAGPAGLGAAIEFNKLPFVEWKLYEKASAIREIGAGISIQPNTWRILELMGAAGNMKPKDFFRAPDNSNIQHRNGRTGEWLSTHGQQSDIPPHQRHARTQRSKLQQALLKEVDQSKISLSHLLVKVSQGKLGRLILHFDNGRVDETDLLVGADGVRSVVRQFAFPDHQIGYTGKTAYRTIVTPSQVAHLELPDVATFWHGPGAWLYTCPLGDNRYEITTMVQEPEEEIKKVSWGQDADPEQNNAHFVEFGPTVRNTLEVSPIIKQYALYAGPRLAKVIAHGSVALVGDASHPLSGAFGAGAGFALEDVYVLTQAIKWAHDNGFTTARALELFNSVRSPHYKKLYDILDEFAKTGNYVKDRPSLSFDEAVKILVDETWGYKHTWMYYYNVVQAWSDAVAGQEKDVVVPQEQYVKLQANI